MPQAKNFVFSFGLAFPLDNHDHLASELKTDLLNSLSRRTVASYFCILKNIYINTIILNLDSLSVFTRGSPEVKNMVQYLRQNKLQVTVRNNENLAISLAKTNPVEANYICQTVVKSL